MKNTTQSGSAIFIVILAVAMFAALSYAVFKDRVGSMSTLSDQQAKLAAEEIIAYGDALAKAVQTLKLRGCSDTQFDFANGMWKTPAGASIHTAGHNASAPSSGCSIFSPSDGRLNALVFSNNYFVEEIGGDTEPGSSRVKTAGMPGVGDSSQLEMIWLLPHLKDEVCLKLNSILGINNPSDAVPLHTQSGGGFNDYNGAYSSGTLVDTSGALTGHTAYCTVRSAGGSTNRYIKTLIVR